MSFPVTFAGFPRASTRAGVRNYFLVFSATGLTGPTARRIAAQLSGALVICMPHDTGFARRGPAGCGTRVRGFRHPSERRRGACHRRQSTQSGATCRHRRGERSIERGLVSRRMRSRCPSPDRAWRSNRCAHDQGSVEGAPRTGVGNRAISRARVRPFRSKLRPSCESAAWITSRSLGRRGRQRGDRRKRLNG